MFEHRPLQLDQGLARAPPRLAMMPLFGGIRRLPRLLKGQDGRSQRGLGILYGAVRLDEAHRRMEEAPDRLEQISCSRLMKLDPLVGSLERVPKIGFELAHGTPPWKPVPTAGRLTPPS